MEACSVMGVNIRLPVCVCVCVSACHVVYAVDICLAWTSV